MGNCHQYPQINHPGAQHMCANLDNIDPRDAVPGGHLDLLVASPECTHHSNAAGSRPVNDQSRSTAWHVLRWAEALRIENILIENVPEFRKWGPLDGNGKRIKNLKGQIYLQFLAQLREAGMQKWLARREITDALDKKGWNATEYKILRDAFEQVDNEIIQKL